MGDFNGSAFKIIVYLIIYRQGEGAVVIIIVIVVDRNVIVLSDRQTVDPHPQVLVLSSISCAGHLDPRLIPDSHIRITHGPLQAAYQHIHRH